MQHILEKDYLVTPEMAEKYHADPTALAWYKASFQDGLLMSQLIEGEDNFFGLIHYIVVAVDPVRGLTGHRVPAENIKIATFESGNLSITASTPEGVYVFDFEDTYLVSITHGSEMLARSFDQEGNIVSEKWFYEDKLTKTRSIEYYNGRAISTRIEDIKNGGVQDTVIVNDETDNNRSYTNCDGTIMLYFDNNGVIIKGEEYVEGVLKQRAVYEHIFDNGYAYQVVEKIEGDDEEIICSIPLSRTNNEKGK